MSEQKIVTFLWFNDNAEEAVDFYCSVFKRSKILDVMRCGGVGPGPRGSVLTITFELEGQQYIALNGGPTFTFNEAISLLVQCDTQDEVDHYWSKLTTGGGQESQCGWLKDKFGLIRPPLEGRAPFGAWLAWRDGGEGGRMCAVAGGLACTWSRGTAGTSWRC